MGEGVEKQEQPLVCALIIYSPNLKNIPTPRQENWNQFSNVNVFLLERAMCVKLALAYVKVVIASMGLKLWAASFLLAQMCVLLLQRNLFMNVDSFIQASLPLLHPACSYSKWMLRTVHLNPSKVSKVLFFSICLRWLELAGRSSRDPCQILMSSVLAFDPLSPLFPGWLLSNSITFSLRQQEIVCSYSRYPSVKANVQSSAQFQFLQRKLLLLLSKLLSALSATDSKTIAVAWVMFFFFYYW